MVFNNESDPGWMTAMLLDMVDIPLHQIISPLFFNEISMKNHHEKPPRFAEYHGISTQVVNPLP
jgi:hypothetical protein